MADITKIDILSADSVDELRSVAESRPRRVWDSGFDELVEELDLRLIPGEYEVDASISLHQPESGPRAENYDAQNSYRALSLLPSLTRADATDERLWTTLALREFSAYLHTRWPFVPGGRRTLSGHLRNHVFTATIRIRERDHAISRLWWTGDYVRRLVGRSGLADALHGLYANSEIPVQVLGRPNIASFPGVGRAIIDICTRHFKDDPSAFDREAFRSLLSGIDYLAGRASFGSLSDERILELVEQRFRAEFELDG